MSLPIGRAGMIVVAVCGSLASGCGRSPIGSMDSRTDAGVGGGGGPAGAAGGAGRVGSGGSSGGGGGTVGDAGPDTTATPDARVDRPDGATDLRDAPPDLPPPDLVPDRQVFDGNTCTVSCTNLPHVRTGVVPTCRASECVLPFGACEDGWAHCRGPSTGGCESNLTTVTDCGACGYTCSGFGAECKLINGFRYCGQRCLAPAADSCGFTCVDLQSDPWNCGSCGNYCSVPNADSTCVQGKCTTGTCFFGYLDCTPDVPGCESQLGTDDNCGACGDKSCGLANTFFTCSNGARCDAAVCAGGFANCDTTSPDCEATFDAGAPCLPHYGDTLALATQAFDVVATGFAPDGSTFLAGVFEGTVDFDPSAARDIRTASDRDAFVTKFNASGSYAWTAVITGRGFTSLNAIAVTSTGAVVVTGPYSDSIDLDPSPTVTVTRQTGIVDQTDSYVLELTAAGQLAWGGALASAADSQVTSYSVAVDASDGIYLAGLASGTVDYDPGPGVASQTPTSGTFSSVGFLVKLTAAGAYHSVRLLDNGNCSVVLSSVTVASDGNVWATGQIDSGLGCPLDDRPITYTQSSAVLIKHDAMNVPLGRWLVGIYANGNAVAPGPAGSIYLAGGAANDQVDYDPGPGVAHRWLSDTGGGFILRLDANAALRWVRVLAGQPIRGLAATPDGGVIGVGQQYGGALVTRLTGDGGSVWSFLAGGSATYASSVSSRGTRFAVAGISSGTVDIDPTAAVDIMFGDVSFVSRYTF